MQISSCPRSMTRPVWQTLWRISRASEFANREAVDEIWRASIMYGHGSMRMDDMQERTAARLDGRDRRKCKPRN
jgi:hypothetical protein